MSKMTTAEVEQIMARPEYANRIAVLVYEDGDDFVCDWSGKEFRAQGCFGLDSRLADAGCPPRNMFLMEGVSAVGVDKP